MMGGHINEGGINVLSINFSKNPAKLSYAYLLTPTGVAGKAVLTLRFLQRKMVEYDKLREEIEALQREESLPL